jgi:hypothetical protein
VDKHHLLYWVFKAYYVRDAKHLTEDDFERIRAPHWAWPNYRERIQKLAREKAERERKHGPSQDADPKDYPSSGRDGAA